MDLVVLKKKISTFRSEGGKLRKVDDEVLYELLIAWEEWTGATRAFYKELGVDHRKMASLLGRAKKLKRELFYNKADLIVDVHSLNINDLTEKILSHPKTTKKRSQAL